MKRLLSLILVAAMSLSISACGANADVTTENANAETTVAQESISDTPAGSFTAGTYTGMGNGKNGEISVSVTFDTDSITSVQVISHAETPVISDLALSDIPTMIVDTQSIGVDVIGGATITSEAIIAAVSSCIEQAGANPADYMIVEEHEARQESLTADVVVVGAGGAGLTAAYEAANAGASVIVVESQSKVGGSTLLSGGMISRYGTADEIANYGTVTKEEFFQAYQIYGSEFFDPIMVKDYIDHMNENITWITNLGYAAEAFDYPWFLSLDPVNAPDETYRFIIHTFPEAKDGDFYYDGFGYGITNTLESACKDLGVTFLLSTTATDLTTENDIVNGVIATSDDNVTYTIEAKSVVLATGGFGANKELGLEYLDTTELYVGAPTNTGFGILAAEKLGAQLEFLYTPADPTSEYPDVYSTVGGVLINQDTQILKEDGTYIENVYAAGELTTIRILGEVSTACGTNNGWSIYTGRIAGKNAAANAGK